MGNIIMPHIFMVVSQHLVTKAFLALSLVGSIGMSYVYNPWCLALFPAVYSLFAIKERAILRGLSTFYNINTKPVDLTEWNPKYPEIAQR